MEPPTEKTPWSRVSRRPPADAAIKTTPPITTEAVASRTSSRKLNHAAPWLSQVRTWRPETNRSRSIAVSRDAVTIGGMEKLPKHPHDSAPRINFQTLTAAKAAKSKTLRSQLVRTDLPDTSRHATEASSPHSSDQGSGLSPRHALLGEDRNRNFITTAHANRQATAKRVILQKTALSMEVSPAQRATLRIATARIRPSTMAPPAVIISQRRCGDGGAPAATPAP